MIGSADDPDSSSGWAPRQAPKEASSAMSRAVIVIHSAGIFTKNSSEPAMSTTDMATGSATVVAIEASTDAVGIAVTTGLGTRIGAADVVGGAFGPDTQPFRSSPRSAARDGQLDVGPSGRRPAFGAAGCHEAPGYWFACATARRASVAMSGTVRSGVATAGRVAPLPGRSCRRSTHTVVIPRRLAGT